jgi:hypothetical protein
MPVIWYHSEETGAPTLNNVAGSLINVLDACLINGFNSKSVTSIVVASNVATATISAHGYETGKVVQFDGATPSGLNGQKRVTVTGTNTVTFPAPGISDGSASGTLTAVRPGLGWTKAYSGTSKAIYARTDVAATAMMWRVDDTAAGVASATYARAVMVESASGIDTYVAPSPTAAQLSGGHYLGKGVSNTTAKSWIVVGDELFVYVFLDDLTYSFASNGGLHPHGFGDFISYRAGDAFGCMVGGGTSTSGITKMTSSSALGASVDTDGNRCIARLSNQLGGSIFADMVAIAPSGGLIGGSTAGAYPSPVNNGIVIQRPVFLRETNASFGNPVRGEMPGLAAPVGSMGLVNHKQVFSNLTGFAGEMLCVTTLNQNSVGNVLLDITGPWR